MNLTTSSTKEDSSLESSLARYSNCPLCTQCHPLYRSEVFESNPVAERRELVYRKGICFNRINCTKHLSKSCKSPIQCKVPGCGKSRHTLLHQPSSTRGNSDHQTNNTEITDMPAITTPLPSVQDASSSTCVLQLQLNPPRFYCNLVPRVSLLCLHCR